MMNKAFLSEARKALLIVLIGSVGFSSVLQADTKKTEASKGNPRSIELNEKGTAAAHAGDLERAQTYFRDALSADPYNLTAVFNLAGMYVTQHKEPIAITLLEDYVKRYPNDAGLLIRLADVYFGTEQVNDAVTYYERGFELDDAYPRVAEKLGAAYTLTNKPEKAEQMFELAVKQAPKNGRLYANLSSLQLSNGKIDAAIASAKKALHLNPTSEVYVTLGTAYELQENYKSSLIAFERARDMGDTRAELKQKIKALKKVVSVG